jgi:hypothetical protein
VADRVDWLPFESEEGAIDVSGLAHIAFDEDCADWHTVSSPVAQIVQYDDLVAPGEQDLCYVACDEPSGAGDQNPHSSSLLSVTSHADLIAIHHGPQGPRQGSSSSSPLSYHWSFAEFEKSIFGVAEHSSHPDVVYPPSSQGLGSLCEAVFGIL